METKLYYQKNLEIFRNSKGAIIHVRMSGTLMKTVMLEDKTTIVTEQENNTDTVKKIKVFVEQPQCILIKHIYISEDVFERMFKRIGL